MKVYSIAEVTMAFVFLYFFSFLFEVVTGMLVHFFRRLVYTPNVHRVPYKKSSHIKQLQLEQDSGKSLHDAELGRSLVDLNRAGAPLIELVFQPDLEDGEEAAALVKELVLIVQRLGACSGRMQEGALRVDANVSVHREREPLGTRTEIKNIGSVRGVAAAVKHEIERQRGLLSRGAKVTSETRAWDAAARVTVPLRDKELVHDYRYMPEPNLPPLRVNLYTTDDHPDILSVPRIKQQIPELPEETRQILTDRFGLRQEAAIQIVNEPVLLQHFQSLVKLPQCNPVKVANVLLNEYMTVLNKNKIDIEDSKVTTEQLSEVIALLSNGTISLDVTKLLILECMNSSVELSVSEVVKENNWSLVSSDEEITKACLDVIENNPELVKKYKSGKVKLLKAMLGIVGKNAQKNYNMSLVAKKMEELLKK